MKFPADAPVQPKKLAELRARVDALELRLEEIDEKAIAGGGSGGQKLNKTASTVVLRYGEHTVRCQESRSKALNRFLALRRLVETLETLRDGPDSRAEKERMRIRKQKDRRRRRAVQEPGDAER